jgi:hypothetical protein
MQELLFPYDSTSRGRKLAESTTFKRLICKISSKTVAMASCSLNSPVITDEDHRREGENLSYEEKKRLEQDIFGPSACDNGASSDVLLEETEELIQNSHRLLQEALDHMDSSLKEDYMKALEVCPLIVERESNPLVFLRGAAFDPMVRSDHVQMYHLLC